MSYDGFYRELSSRGTANDALNQIVTLKDKVVVLAAEVEVSADRSENAAAIAEVKSTEAINSAASALTSKASAEISETLAVLSAQQAAIALVATSRFCGVSAIAPSTRLDGSALQQADEYQNSGDKLRYSWSGTAWVALNSSAQALESQLALETGPEKIPNALAYTAKVDTLRSRTNTSKSFSVNAPSTVAGVVDRRPPSTMNYVRTGVIDRARVGLFKPPYAYDQAGNQYVERRGVSHQHIPQRVLDDVPKLLSVTPSFPGTQLVAVPRLNGGYVLIGLVNNVTTTFESLATTVNDETMRRESSVLSAVSVLVGKKDSYSQTGVWSDSNLGSVLPEVPAFNSQSYWTYKETTNKGATLSFSAAPFDGFVTLSFICSSSSNPAANISIDGTNHVVDLTSSQASIRHFKFATPKKSVQVVITNTSSSIINFLGRDFSTLREWKGAPIDAWAYYRNTETEEEYLNNNSEQTYVLRELISNTYGGGYHGGESNIEDNWTVDGVAVVPSASPVVGRRISLRSKATIDWTPAGSSVSVAIGKRYDFINGGYYSEVSIDGDIRCSELYSALFGVNETFSKLDAPIRADLSEDVANKQRLLLGRATSIVMRNPTTGQTFQADLTLHQIDSASQYGGLFIWRVDGTYKKAYYAPVHGGDLSINGSYSLNCYRFAAS